MGTQQPTETASAQALLPPWANYQDGWCRSIAADVLRLRVQPADADVDRYLKVLLAEKKLSGETFEPVPKIEEKQPIADSLEIVRIDALTVGDGVNALKTGVQIDFAPGVTVIFGENGSGKSGFVRILKRAGGVRTAEDILHNVRTDKKPTPCATFGVTVGATGQKVEWKNEFGIPPLNRLSVFDTRGARLHLEDELTYVYTPGELTLFPMVQNGIERVRAALETAIGKRTPGTNTLLASFDRSSTIYSTIETLSAATDLNEISQYAVVPDDVDAQIDSLKTEVDALRSTNIQNELKRAQDRSALVTALKTALDEIKAFDPTVFEARLQERDEASRRREDAVTKAFEGLAIPGLLGPEWRQFVQAGEEYLKKHAPVAYPEGEQPCAYCRQPLTAAAVDLVKKYRQFTNNEITVAFQLADGQLRAYAQTIGAVDIEALQQQPGARPQAAPTYSSR